MQEIAITSLADQFRTQCFAEWLRGRAMVQYLVQYLLNNKHHRSQNCIAGEMLMRDDAAQVCTGTYCNDHKGEKPCHASIRNTP